MPLFFLYSAGRYTGGDAGGRKARLNFLFSENPHFLKLVELLRNAAVRIANLESTQGNVPLEPEGALPRFQCKKRLLEFLSASKE